MDGIKGRLTIGAAWMTAARILTSIFGAVSTIVLARLLLPADFGLIALGWTILAILNSFSEISVASVLIHHKNPTRSHLDTAWTLSALRAGAVCVVIALIAYPLAHAFDEDRLPPVLISLALASFVGGLASPRRILLTRDLQFWQQFLFEVGQKLTGVVVSTAFALAFRNYWALVAGALASELVGVVISYVVAPYLPRPGLRHWRETLRYTIWLTFSQALNAINWRFDQLLIGWALGKTALGYYVVGDNLAAIPTREATAPLTSTLFPAFSNVNNREDGNLAWSYRSAQTLVTMIALPVGLGMALVADPLVRLMLTDKWLPSVIVIQALSAIFALQTLGNLAQPLAMATGHTRLLFKRDLQAFLMRVPMVFAGMYLGGVAGVAIARALAGVVGMPLNLQVIRQLTGLSFMAQLRPNTRSLCSALFMALVVLAAKPYFHNGNATLQLLLELVGLVTIGGVSYVGAQLLQWKIAGFPDGPESALVSLMRKLLLSGAAKMRGQRA